MRFFYSGNRRIGSIIDKIKIIEITVPHQQKIVTEKCECSVELLHVTYTYKFSQYLLTTCMHKTSISVLTYSHN